LLLIHISISRRRSEGAHINFPIECKQDKVTARLPITSVQAFTTRPETLYGVTFLAVASNHPLAEMAHDVVARHPLTKEAIPVVVGHHVVADYGTGVVMGVPGHDERDATLAHELGLPVRTVLNEDDRCIDSGPLDGLATDAARAEVLKLLEQARSGERVVNYR
jgi:leucyl-tRNA synthetase